jgi:hypothetical protein
MLGYILVAVFALFGLWQVYVLFSGRAKFGGYTTPIILLAVSCVAVYIGLRIETPTVVAPPMMGGRRYRW